MFCDLMLFKLKETTSKTPGLTHSVILWPQGQHFKTCLRFQFCQCCQCCQCCCFFFFFSNFSFTFHSWFNNSYPSVAGSIKNVEAGVALSLVLGRHTKAWIWIAPKIGPFGYSYYNDSYYDNPIAHESTFHLQKQPVFPLKFFFFFSEPSIGHLTLGFYGKSGTKADSNLHDLLQILTHLEALYILGLMSLFSIFQSQQWGIFKSLSLSLCYYLDHHTILCLALTTSAYLLQDNLWIISCPPRKFMIISPFQYP